ncbi:MAG: hypothetical protein K0S55_1491 [Clostridia bacterium]|nr:hypothetical protein [Clostridia bacterium]
MKELNYITKDVCSRKIKIAINDNNTIKSVEFFGGCSGNANGISKLVMGLDVDEVIKMLKGTVCGYKKTSCPDQLAKALEEIKASH